MAAFSSQCHPFLVESALFFSNNNTPIKPSPTLFMDPHQPLLPPSQTLRETPFSVTNYHDARPVGQTSKITINDSEPSSVTKNQSTETSMVVDKLETGEQVTQKMVTPVQRKKRNRNGSSLNSAKTAKDTIEGRNKKQKMNNGGGGGGKEEEKGKAGKRNSEEPPNGLYIHVRARRGQATDSHSLAKRVRQEKISKRMKMLQKLVPACDKVTGKALTLDEIINYVQSLQTQVEFLSMKLASVNPVFYDFTVDLDTLMLRPEKLNSNSLAPVPSTLLQCNPNQATTFVNTTTVTATVAAVDAALGFPRANDYLQYNSTSYLLHGQGPNLFSEDNISQFWDVEDQRQKLLNPYGLSNNICSFH